MTIPEPFVLFRDFGASSLDFELRCFIGNITRQLQIASALRFKIDAAFREANIEFPFQQRVVHMVPPEDGWAHFENSQDPQTSHPSTCRKSTLSHMGHLGHCCGMSAWSCVSATGDA